MSLMANTHIDYGQLEEYYDDKEQPSCDDNYCFRAFCFVPDYEK